MNGISLQFVDYKGDPAELARRVDAMIKAAGPPPGAAAPAALVVPHAGYVYSGPIAGYAYRAVQGQRYDTVVILGPSHREPFVGISVLDAAQFESPLGKIPCDRDLVGRLLKAHPNIAYRPEAHRNEHSLEVQVPFLQRALEGFQVVFAVLGGHDPEAEMTFVNTVVDYARGKKVLLVASSDLSHYHGYDEANRLDTQALRSIVALDAFGLEKDVRSGRCEACGILPVLTVMNAVKKMGISKGVLLKQANSGDTAGPKDQVVGYAAVAYYPEAAARSGRQPAASQAAPVNPGRTRTAGRLDARSREELLALARRTIEVAVRGSGAQPAPPSNPALHEKQGAFVTITIGGELRGCIGTFQANEPLTRVVSQMAVQAALHDPRFPPLAPAELPKIHLEISALSPMRPVRDVSEIEVGRHGIYITKGYRSGVLLPQVATEYGWDRTTFLEQTCRKAGLGRDEWKDGATIQVFEAEVFGEPEAARPGG